MVLKGYRLTRALRISKLAAWAVAGLMGLLVVWQAARLVSALGSVEVGVLEEGAVVSTRAEAGEQEPVSIEDLAVIWEAMDPEPPQPTTAQLKPEPVPIPKPPRDPYPDMRLLGTIVEEGRAYALIRIRRGNTVLLRQGEAFEDVRLVEVTESEVTVSAAGRRKTLRIEREHR